MSSESPLDQLLALIPKLFEGNGNLATLTSLLPSGVLSTILNSPYGDALVDVLNSQVGNRPLEYSDRLLSIFPIPRWAWTGTGVVKVVKMAHQVVGNELPKHVVNLVMTTQYNIYGNFPTTADIAPSAIFVAVNGVLMIAHFYVFAKGCSRNHYFWPSFGLGWHCILNMLGFGMRIGWANNVLNIPLGIASTIMIVVSIVYVNSMNLLLAHRILTYRHPETGDATWFGSVMILVYLVIIGVIVMAVIAQVVMFVYFLDYTHWKQAMGAMQAASVLATLVAIGGVFVIALAYALPRGALSLHHDDRRRLPASNVESYGVFYFPPKYSQVLQYQADPSAKIDSGKLAARVINGRQLSTSAGLIVATSIILTTTAGMRCATCFLGDRWSPSVKPIYGQTLFYIGFGLFETIVNVIYLLVRIDLRFYIPDWPLKGTGPLTIKPGTMEILNDPYGQAPGAPHIGGGYGPDEKQFDKAHFEEVQPPLAAATATYGPSFPMSPEVMRAASAMNMPTMPTMSTMATMIGTPMALQQQEDEAEKLAEKNTNRHTGFTEATRLPGDSEFVDPIPRLPSPVHRSMPPKLDHNSHLQQSPQLPQLPELTLGGSPVRGHSPSSLQREELDQAPQLPQIIPTPFPQTPYQVRAVTPAAFPTPMLPPATPQQFPDAHYSMSTFAGHQTPMDRGFTPVMSRGFTPVQDLSEPTYGVPYTERVSIPSPVHDYDPHYGRPYEEPKDEFLRTSRDSEDI